MDDADADQGVAPDGEDDEPPELLDRYDDDSSDDEVQTTMARAKAMAMMIVKTMKRKIMSTKRNLMRTVLVMKSRMNLVLCREHSVAGPSDRQIISFPP